MKFTSKTNAQIHWDISGNTFHRKTSARNDGGFALQCRHMDCPFCNLAQEKERLVLETSNVIVILSDPYLVAGHLLVIPKRHIEKPWEMTAEERRELFDTVLLMQQRLIETFSTGCDIREHYRPFLPQSRVKVDHIHFHLHPREFNDPLYTESQIGENQLWKNLIKKETTQITKRFPKVL